MWDSSSANHSFWNLRGLMFGLIITCILLISLAKKHTFPHCMNSDQVSDKTNIKRRFKTFTKLPSFRICKMSPLGHLWLLVSVSQVGKKKKKDNLLTWTHCRFQLGSVGLMLSAYGSQNQHAWWEMWFHGQYTLHTDQDFNFNTVLELSRCVRLHAIHGGCRPWGWHTFGCLGYLHKA